MYIGLYNDLKYSLLHVHMSLFPQPLPCLMGGAWKMTVLIMNMCSHCRYVNGVKPGRYGVPKPFYFPLLPSYWMGRPRRSKNTEVCTCTVHYVYNCRYTYMFVCVHFCVRACMCTYVYACMIACVCVLGC